MMCEYKDGFKVDYSGAVHITKGDGVDLTVQENAIPTNIKSCLDSAVNRNSCHELRAAAGAWTTSFDKAIHVE